MSDIVEIKTELFYQGPFNSNPTGLASFTTEASLMANFPVCMIPINFFRPPGKCLRVKASGAVGSTGTPTFTWTVRLLTSSTWSAGGLAWTTGALTTVNNAAQSAWTLELDLWCFSYAAGANSGLRGTIEVRCPASLASPFGAQVDNVVTTYNSDVQNFLFLSAACSVSNMSNAININQMKVYGEN